MAGSETQVRPNYGPQPRGRANIMKQGQTENPSNAWGSDPMATETVPAPRDNPDL